MSTTILPVFKDHVPGADFDDLGEGLAYEFLTLDELALEHDLPRIADFADNREVPDDFDGTPEELEELQGPWEEWFSCHEAHIAFTTLADFIANNPESASSLESPDDTVEELRAIAEVLAKGEATGAQFRLEMY
jgi:hypothetical protein